MRRRRARLLFIAPVVPAPAGNGLGMRAGLFLDALAADHEVRLLVVPAATPAEAATASEFVRRRTRSAVVLPVAGRGDSLFSLITRLKDPAARAAALAAYPRPALCRFATPQAVRDSAALFADTSIDVVHVMRLYLAPFAAPYLEAAARTGHPTCVLDLADDEPRTRRCLAARHAARGHLAAAAAGMAEADKYERLEAAELPRFHQALVCSEIDAAAVTRRVPGPRVAVVPNAVRVPLDAARRSEPGTASSAMRGRLTGAPGARRVSEGWNRAPGAEPGGTWTGTRARVRRAPSRSTRSPTATSSTIRSATGCTT